MDTSTTKLYKLGIESLNEMQKSTFDAISANKKVIILSPTGSGKTLAFLMPLLEKVDVKLVETQMLVIAPSRELAQQTHEVLKTLGTGLKVNVVYGGRTMSYEKQNFKSAPHVIIGTPGRIMDHLQKQNISAQYLTNIVIDEYDKCLEIGFEDQINDIFSYIPVINKLVLTSATVLSKIPYFLGSKPPLTLNFLNEQKPDIHTLLVKSIAKDKLESVGRLLLHTQKGKGIIFCNFKESIDRVSQFLAEKGIPHSVYHGGLEQLERELALIKFRNGSNRLLLSTDLAARGLDIPDIDFIVHYHLPLKEEEYTHRNGRTARMMKGGEVYVIHWTEEILPEFIHYDETLDASELIENDKYQDNEWTTLQISAGRKDKVSKGDIVGFLCQKSQINSTDINHIELKDLVSYVGVKQSKIKQIVQSTDNQKLKVKNVRIKHLK
jgi:superfamily II DNA/RNA helicase